MYAFHAFAAAVPGNGLPGLRHTLKIAVGNGSGFPAFHGAADAFGQGHAKGGGIAGVQLQHLNALCLHPHGLVI